MPFDPTNPRFASPLAGVTQDRLTGMMNQPQTKVFATAPQDNGTTPGSPILPGQMQINQTMGMARGGPVVDELAGVKETIRGEFAKRGLDFDRFVSNPAVMDEVGKAIQSQGQSGDTILAHINPQEATVLKEMGGSGDINPHTGLPQFDNPSMGAYDAPSSSSVSPGLSGFGGGSSSPSGVSGGGGGGSLGPRGPITSSGQSPGYRPSGGGGGSGIGSVSGPSSSISPMGAGRGSISMGSQQSSPSEATGSIPSFAGVDPMSGLPIGGASNLSSLGQLATAPTLTPAPAIGAGPVDLGNTQPQLSGIDFSNINAGMYPGATMPGGVSNFAASPIDPGYTDVGVTAMRMAAGQGDAGTIDRRTGIGQGTEYNLAKLNELDPVSQTQGATILNRMMDLGYSPGFDQFGVGRTMAQQAALYNAADGNLTAAPGRSMHNFGLAMDVENLNDQGYRDLARIAGEEGWGWGGSQDPAHVQMAPWGVGAMQTAQRLGAQPFTGATQTAASVSPLKSALNTVSDIATELFGVKSAAAQTQENTALENLFKATEPFGGEEIMSPFVGTGPANMAFPPQSQQQMLAALGISPGPVSPVSEAQIAGSGVFPSNAQLGLKEQGRAPGAGPNYPEVQEVINITPPATPMQRFGLPGDMATYGAEQEPVNYPRMGIDAFGFAGPFGMSELTVPSADLENPLDERGTPYPQVPLDPNSYQNYSLNPEFAYQQMLGSLGWKSMFAPPKEEAIAKMTSALERSGSMYDPTTGTVYAQDPATMQKALGVVPIELKDSNGNVVGTINAADFLTPIETAARTVPLPPTRITETMAAPVATPQTGLTSFESALGSVPVAAPPAAATPAASLTRQEPADPTQSTSPMTADQLKEMGIYRDTLQPGETVRQDFNAAYADATKRGIETFEWTNPATGATGVYKSGADDANLPAGTAKPASGKQAPQTEYEKTVATLEDAGQIANGMSKEEYAEAMGVPVEEVRTRITTQFGPPMAEYYTKTVLESLAGMTGGKTNLEGAANLMSMFSPLGILGLAGKAMYNQYKNKPVQKAEGGYIAPPPQAFLEPKPAPPPLMSVMPVAQSPLNVATPQIQLPQIDLTKFATPYTGVSPDYKPPVAPPPPATPPTPTQDPKDWLKSKFENWRDAPRKFSAWQEWFKSNISDAPQNIKDWYSGLPTDKRGFMSALPNFRSLYEDRERDGDKRKTALAEYAARVRQPMPSTYGGYGGEYSYFAKGGAVSPLNAMGKK